VSGLAAESKVIAAISILTTQGTQHCPWVLPRRVLRGSIWTHEIAHRDFESSKIQVNKSSSKASRLFPMQQWQPEQLQSKADWFPCIYKLLRAWTKANIESDIPKTKQPSKFVGQSAAPWRKTKSRQSSRYHTAHDLLFVVCIEILVKNVLQWVAATLCERWLYSECFFVYLHERIYVYIYIICICIYNIWICIYIYIYISIYVYTHMNICVYK